MCTEHGAGKASGNERAEIVPTHSTLPRPPEMSDMPMVIGDWLRPARNTSSVVLGASVLDFRPAHSPTAKVALTYAASTR